MFCRVTCTTSLGVGGTDHLSAWQPCIYYKKQLDLLIHSLLSREVGHSPLQGFDILLELADGTVAVEAEQPSDTVAAACFARAACVVMIDVECSRRRVAADGADAPLSLHHLVVLLLGYPVLAEPSSVEAPGALGAQLVVSVLAWGEA